MYHFYFIATALGTLKLLTKFCFGNILNIAIVLQCK